MKIDCRIHSFYSPLTLFVLQTLQTKFILISVFFSFFYHDKDIKVLEIRLECKTFSPSG